MTKQVQLKVLFDKSSLKTSEKELQNTLAKSSQVGIKDGVTRGVKDGAKTANLAKGDWKNLTQSLEDALADPMGAITGGVKKGLNAVKNTAFANPLAAIGLAAGTALSTSMYKGFKSFDLFDSWQKELSVQIKDSSLIDRFTNLGISVSQAFGDASREEIGAMAADLNRVGYEIEDIEVLFSKLTVATGGSKQKMQEAVDVLEDIAVKGKIGAGEIEKMTKSIGIEFQNNLLSSVGHFDNIEAALAAGVINADNFYAAVYDSTLQGQDLRDAFIEVKDATNDAAQQASDAWSNAFLTIGKKMGPFFKKLEDGFYSVSKKAANFVNWAFGGNSESVVDIATDGGGVTNFTNVSQGSNTNTNRNNPSPRVNRRMPNRSVAEDVEEALSGVSLLFSETIEKLKDARRQRTAAEMQGNKELVENWDATIDQLTNYANTELAVKLPELIEEGNVGLFDSLSSMVQKQKEETQDAADSIAKSISKWEGAFSGVDSAINSAFSSITSFKEGDIGGGIAGVGNTASTVGDMVSGLGEGLGNAGMIGSAISAGLSMFGSIWNLFDKSEEKHQARLEKNQDKLDDTLKKVNENLEDLTSTLDEEIDLIKSERDSKLSVYDRELAAGRISSAEYAKATSGIISEAQSQIDTKEEQKVLEQQRAEHLTSYAQRLKELEDEKSELEKYYVAPHERKEYNGILEKIRKIQGAQNALKSASSLAEVERYPIPAKKYAFTGFNGIINEPTHIMNSKMHLIAGEYNQPERLSINPNSNSFAPKNAGPMNIFNLNVNLSTLTGQIDRNSINNLLVSIKDLAKNGQIPRANQPWLNAEV